MNQMNKRDERDERDGPNGEGLVDSPLRASHRKVKARLRLRVEKTLSRNE